MKLFINSLSIVSALTYLTLITSATGSPPFVSSSYPNEETAIQPGSIISGYPIPPAYTLSRYDEDYSYLAKPANRTHPLDVIKYIPLFHWDRPASLPCGMIFASMQKPLRGRAPSPLPQEPGTRSWISASTMPQTDSRFSRSTKSTARPTRSIPASSPGATGRRCSKYGRRYREARTAQSTTRHLTAS